MESKAGLLTNPVQQLLVVLPLGLLTTAVVFDLVTISGGDSGWSTSAFYMIGAGIIGGLIAAIFGFRDWLASGTRARAIGAWDGLGNLLVILLFAASWYLRSAGPDSPTNAAVTLSFAGAGLSLVTGWLGAPGSLG